MLSNQSVFITGACGLIGKRFVDVVINNNAKVIAVDISKAGLDTLQQKYDDSVLLTIEADVNDSESVQGALQQAELCFEEIDALVNAAYPRNKQFGRHYFDVEYDDFCENLNLNVGSSFLVSKVFAQYFKEKGKGNIVNLGSIYGVVAPDFDIYEDTQMTMPVEYAAIKSGVIHLTKYMAKYLKKNGVRVNCISPGGVLDNQPQDFLDKYNKKCGQQGMLKPEHLDSTLLYFLSNLSGAVTGQNIIVDDGFTL